MEKWRSRLNKPPLPTGPGTLTNENAPSHRWPGAFQFSKECQTVWQGSYGTAYEERKPIFKIFRGRRQAARRLIIPPAQAKVSAGSTTLESLAVCSSHALEKSLRT